MHLFTVVMLAAAAVLFAVDAWLSRSLLALGLFLWVLAFLIPLMAA